MLLIFPNPQEPFGRNSNTIQTPPNGADLNYTANPSSSFPSLPWTQAISRGTLWCFPPPAPFFHSVSLPLARACWWLEAKELSGNWIQSQDNKDKNKMQVRATPLSPPEPKNESAFANGNGSRHVSPRRANTGKQNEPDAMKGLRNMGLHVCLTKVGHTRPRTLNYQINKLKKWHFKSNCIDLVDVPRTHQINNLRIKSNQKMNYALH